LSLAGLDSDALTSISIFSPDITELNLQLCGRLNNATMAEYSKRLTQLHSIELSGPYLVYIAAWHEFFDARAGQLESFKIRESPRFEITCCQKLVDTSPQLRELGLAQVGPLNGECLAVLQPLKHLEYLDISDPGVSTPGVPAESLKDMDVVELLSHVGKDLTYLDVGGNIDLSGDFLLSGVLEYCQSLRTLRVNQVASLEGQEPSVWSDLFLGFSEQKRPGLEYLNLERCTSLTDEGFIAMLAHSGPTLRELNINSCTALTAEALERIAEFCPVLETLDVGFVRSVKDSVIMALCNEQDGCPALKRVSVFGCMSLS
jgi:DNA repair protein RAD7